MEVLLNKPLFHANMPSCTSIPGKLYRRWGRRLLGYALELSVAYDYPMLEIQ